MYTCMHASNGKEGENDVKYIMKYQFKLSHDQGWNKRFTKLNVMQKRSRRPRELKRNTFFILIIDVFYIDKIDSTYLVKEQYNNSK